MRRKIDIRDGVVEGFDFERELVLHFVSVGLSTLALVRPEMTGSACTHHRGAYTYESFAITSRMLCALW